MRGFRILLMLLSFVTPLAHAHGPSTQVSAPFPSALSVLAHGKAGDLLTPGWIDTAVISAKAPVGTGVFHMTGGDENSRDRSYRRWAAWFDLSGV